MWGVMAGGVGRPPPTNPRPAGGGFCRFFTMPRGARRGGGPPPGRPPPPPGGGGAVFAVLQHGAVLPDAGGATDGALSAPGRGGGDEPGSGETCVSRGAERPVRDDRGGAAGRGVSNGDGGEMAPVAPDDLPRRG